MHHGARYALPLTIQGDLGGDSEGWDRLVDRQPIPTPTLKSWWLDSATTGDPHFLLVHDGNTLVGGLALERERWRGVDRFREMGRLMWPSHFDLIAEPGYEDEVVRSISSWMLRRGNRMFELRALAQSTRLTRVGRHQQGSETSGVAWCGSLSGAGGVSAGLSSSMRKNLRRTRRRMEDAGAYWERVPATQVEEALTTLERLHGALFGNQSTFLPFFDAFAQAARVGVRREEMAFFQVLDSEGKPVVIDVWMYSAWRVANYIGGRALDAPAGAGKVLLLAALEDAAQFGFHEFDLGGGYGGWKRDWANLERPLKRHAFALGLRARALVALRDSSIRSALMKRPGLP